MVTSTDPQPVRRGNLFSAECPTRIVLDRVGGKWVAMVVKLLSDNDPVEVRFGELSSRMPGVSHKMLSQTLKALVRSGLVERRVEPTIPPRVHYRLTDLGRSLGEPLAALREWAEAHAWEVTELEARHDTTLAG